MSDEAATSSADTTSHNTQQPLLAAPPKRRHRPRHLHLLSSPSSHYTAEPSPITPCSVFSFDLPNSPAVVSARPRFSRSQSSEHGGPVSPRSLFSFELPFGSNWGSQRTLRTTPTTPATPLTPMAKTPAYPLLPTIEEGRGSFSFGADSIKGEDASSTSIISIPLDKKTDWSSIKLIMIVILCTRIQFTVYFASLWPFLQEIDSTASTQDFAYINVGYSVGIAAAAPFFGYWSNKLGCIRIPSIFSMLLMLFTNFMYIFLHNFNENGKYAMAFARCVAGIAAGGNALLPTYWTYAAAPEDRSMAAAMFDGAFCLGIAIGPGLQLLFSLIGYPGSTVFQYIQLNMYTVPAIVANLMIFFTLFLMIFKFKEVPMAKKEKSTKRGSVASGVSSCSSAPTLPPYDKLAVFLCIFGKMVQMFIYASMETIGSMFTQKMFGLSRDETTQYNSILVGLSGLVGFLFLLTYVWTKIGKRIDNRVGVLCGIFVCVGFLLATYSWPFYGTVIENDVCKNVWCSTTPRIPQLGYSLAYVIVFGVGFAMMNVHLAAMYSSVLGPRRQGTMHGVNTLLASCSRIFGPIAVTNMFTELGPQVVWLFQLGTWGLLLIPLTVFYKRMVPCVPMFHAMSDSTEEEEEEENSKA